MSREPGLLGRILDLPADDGDSPKAATFARGLALGALVGAAIAGSTIWQRRHPRTKARVAPGQAVSDDSSTPVSPEQRH